MNQFAIFTLKVFRKIYRTVFRIHEVKPKCEQDADKVSELIYHKLMSDKPLMIARFGSTELTCLVNYLGVKKDEKNIFGFIQGRAHAWWWQPSIINQMQNYSGFFPPKVDKIEQFCQLMLEDKNSVDILGSWLSQEQSVEDGMHATKVDLLLLEPFWSNTPWTKALENKKVLVIHPFAKTILSQYEKRKFLFKNKNILPEFKSLTVIKAVQSLGKGDDRFKDWFAALEFMKSEIDKVDYDICLIGAGAYGFPLAAHVKRKGKKAIHLGGSLQLIFGIRGRRWEVWDDEATQFKTPKGFYVNLMNKYWSRPDENEKPKAATNVEGGCYW